MSNISIVYDRVLEVLASTFPTRKRISNPYSLKDNNEMELREGYGVKVGAANPRNDLEWCSRVSAVRFGIVFTDDTPRNESDEKPIDDYTKVLLEAVNTVQGLFFSYNELDIEENVLQIEIDGTDAIEPILGNDGNKYLSIETSFLISIKERL